MKTKEELLKSIYYNQRKRAKRRQHPYPSYTILELKEWLFNHPNFDKLFNDWVESGCNKDLIPSINRKKNHLSYTFDNIELMIWKQNDTIGHQDMRSGLIIHGNNPQKAVLQYTLENEFVAEYVSIAEASRQTGISRNYICEVCVAKQKKCSNGRLYTARTAGGYIWKHKE